MLSKPYMRLYGELNGNVFTKTQARKVLKTSDSAASVVLTRLKKDNSVYQTERATYRLMKPENRVKLEALKKKNRGLHQLAVQVYTHYPNLSMLLLYGSQVRGDADIQSDYDILVVLPQHTENPNSVKKSIEKKLGIRLHLTVYSEKTYKTILLTEPYTRMWLSEGIVFDEKNLANIIPPPPPKMAYKEMLYATDALIEVAEMEDHTVTKAKYYMKALNILLIIGDMLNLKYEYSETRKRLHALLGDKTVNSIRHSKKLDKRELNELRKKTMREHKKISEKIKALGENESDQKWRKMIS